MQLLVGRGALGSSAGLARWYESTGRHSPLSRDLQRRHYRVAALLLPYGSVASVLGGADLVAATACDPERIASLIGQVAGQPERRAEVYHPWAVSVVLWACMVEYMRCELVDCNQQLMAGACRVEGMLLAAGAAPPAAHHIHLPSWFQDYPPGCGLSGMGRSFWLELLAVASGPLEAQPPISCPHHSSGTRWARCSCCRGDAVGVCPSMRWSPTHSSSSSCGAKVSWPARREMARQPPTSWHSLDLR